VTASIINLALKLPRCEAGAGKARIEEEMSAGRGLRNANSEVHAGTLCDDAHHDTAPAFLPTLLTKVFDRFSHQGGRPGTPVSVSAWCLVSSNSDGHVKIYSEEGKWHDRQAGLCRKPRKKKTSPRRGQIRPNSRRDGVDPGGEDEALVRETSSPS